MCLILPPVFNRKIREFISIDSFSNNWNKKEESNDHFRPLGNERLISKVKEKFLR